MMRTATCDVCTAYIADVQPVPGIAPDGTQKDDRIGDLRIVCDDCERTHEVIVRGKGVQPPDGTTERLPLPKPDHKHWVDDGIHGQYEERTGGFTAGQMEEHAKAALAAFADLLGIMIASATQIVDGDAVVGYEIKTGALHSMLGMFGGTVHIPLGLPSRDAVCAEPSMSTTSPSAYGVTDAPAGYCVKGDDDCVCITNMHLCINFRHIEGGAKP